MFVGQENKTMRKVGKLRLHRESDAHGDFYVAFLIPPAPKASFDFRTFGARQAEEAKSLALEYARNHRLSLDPKIIRTDEDQES